MKGAADSPTSTLPNCERERFSQGRTDHNAAGTDRRLWVCGLPLAAPDYSVRRDGAGAP